jgi:hypothetical protein
MNKRSYIKKAVILLLTIGMISSTIAVAKTNQNQPTLYTTESNSSSQGAPMSSVAWVNGMGYTVGSLAAQYYPGDLDAFPADDFSLTATYSVDTVLWQGGYYNCQYATGGHDYGFIWNITFYNNNATGNKPGTVYQTYSFQNSSITRSFWYSPNITMRWYANYSVTLDPPITLNANQHYWIGIYAYNMTFPQAGWVRHNATVGGLKLHEGMFKSAYFGYPDWVNTSTPALLNMACDFNFQLEGTVATAPVLQIDTIKGPIGVKATIKNTGDAKATNVDWNIAFTGGTIFFGGAKNGTIAEIAVGDVGIAKIPFVLGFGKSVIGVSVSCDEGASASKNQNATVLLFLVLTK